MTIIKFLIQARWGGFLPIFFKITATTYPTFVSGFYPVFIHSNHISMQAFKKKLEALHSQLDEQINIRQNIAEGKPKGWSKTSDSRKYQTKTKQLQEGLINLAEAINDINQFLR